MRPGDCSGRVPNPYPIPKTMPTSLRKLASARANARKSTGPVTAAGKAASSLNAVTHGLTAQTVVLHNESRDQYQAELDHYLAHFQPQGKPEFDLVRQLAAAHWRLCRYASVESSLFEHQMEQDQEWIDDRFDNVDDPRRIAIAFDRMSGPNSALALLNRYQARLHREYRETLRTLEKLQAARIARVAELPSEANPTSEHANPRTIADPRREPTLLMRPPALPTPPILTAPNSTAEPPSSDGAPPLRISQSSPHV